MSQIFQQAPRLLQEHTKLGLGVRRPEVLHDPLPPTRVLRDLYRRRPRRGPHPPDERHHATVEDPLSA